MNHVKSSPHSPASRVPQDRLHPMRPRTRGHRKPWTSNRVGRWSATCDGHNLKVRVTESHQAIEEAIGVGPDATRHRLAQLLGHDPDTHYRCATWR